jgi:Saxitoxin biosynthesis operon protein SxtJ
MMDKIKTDKITLRNFGFILAGSFILISLIIFTKHKYSVTPTAVIALCFMLMATFAPVSLKYLYILWMKLVYILSWINTRLLLGIVFYLVFAPVGLFMRLFRIDPLERKFKPFIDSYWKLKAPKSQLSADYRRQS